MAPGMVVDLAATSKADEPEPAADGGLAMIMEAVPFPDQVQPRESGTPDSEPDQVGVEQEAATAPVEIIAPSSSSSGPRLDDNEPSAGRKAVRGMLLLLGAAIGAFLVLSWLNPSQGVSDLSAGQCVEDFFPTNDDGTFIGLSSISIVDCGQEHAYEVIAVSSDLFPDDEYPGVRESFVTGQAFCLDEYGSFIGGGQENLATWDVWTFVPPESQWDGPRTVQCLVGDATESGLNTGTLRDAAAVE